VNRENDGNIRLLQAVMICAKKKIIRIREIVLGIKGDIVFGLIVTVA